MYTLKPYFHPDFTKECFVNAPNVKIGLCPKDAVAPEGYHAMSIYPEYFRTGGRWLLAGESRMDCVAVLKDGKVCEEGSPEEIFGSPKTERLQQFLKSVL